jgi:RNA polymerase primary sigma factor
MKLNQPATQESPISDLKNINRLATPPARKQARRGGTCKSSLTAADKQKLFELSRSGVSAVELAELYGKSKTMIHSVLMEVQIAWLQSADVAYIDSEEFHVAGAAKIEQESPPEPSSTAAAPKLPVGLPSYLMELYGVPLLNKAQEQYYFRLMNYLKFRYSQLREKLDPKRPRRRLASELESLLERITSIKTLLIRSNLRLVVSIAKRHLKPTSNFFELVSDGNISLMKAVEKFDYSRGFKFSTYASWAIMKNFARSVPADVTRRERFRTGCEEAFLNSSDSRSTALSEERTNREQRQVILEMMKELDGREQTVISRRFGLEPVSQPETLEQVGQRLGVTKERIRQIEVRCLEKLRRIAMREHVDIPGI